MLEEDGLLVVVLAMFAIVLLVTLRRGLAVDGWLAVVAGLLGFESTEQQRLSARAAGIARLWSERAGSLG